MSHHLSSEHIKYYRASILLLGRGVSFGIIQGISLTANRVACIIRVYPIRQEVLCTLAKSITIRLDEDLQKAAKKQAIDENKTLQDYVIELITKDLKAKGAI